MGEVRSNNMNPHEMDSGYPDSLNSSPGSRETDSDHRWEAHDSGGGGGSRVRLMCSFGGKIQQRSHDNQLSYVGGDTRILAVDRNIRFSGMVGKLSSLWGNGVSFKYQLPNEDLDALVSVTNDEDMENMMVENDRLQKMSCRSSRLRLFVFTNRHDGPSSENHFGAPVEERKRENWFVDALNVGLVNRSESAGPQGPWVKKMPDFLFGLGGNGVEDDRDSGRRGYSGHETNSKEQEVYMGGELRLPETGNYPRSGHSSIDSTASAPARLNSTGTLHKPVDSSTVPEIGTRKGAADRMANTNTKTQKQEQHASEFSAVSSSPAHEREPQHPQLQVPIQEFQKFHLRQPEETVPWPVDPNTNLRKIYSGHERAVDFSHTRPDLAQDQPHMEAQNHQSQFPSEYYTQEQRSHFVAQSYQQMPDPHGDHRYPVYYVHPESPGQPAAAYYNPVQTVTSPVQVYSPEAAAPVSTARAALTAQRKGGSSDPTETYRDVSQIHAPVFKGPYTQAPSGRQVASGYRPVAPVPHGHTEPYPYQNAVYDQSSRPVYYTQAPLVMNPQYQLSSSGNVSPLDFHDSSSSEVP